MTHKEFNHLLDSIKALPPEQMRQLRDELDGQIAASATARTPDLKQPSARQERKPIWEVFQEISAAVPDEVWDALPTDLSEQHDHYIYGTPKRTDA
jgi:hypothetical protein